MPIEPALRAYVLADPAVSALIGTRWYPVVLPQSTAFPAVTYQRITTTRVGSHHGPSGLAAARFQIDIQMSYNWDRLGFRYFCPDRWQNLAMFPFPPPSVPSSRSLTHVNLFHSRHLGPLSGYVVTCTTLLVVRTMSYFDARTGSIRRRPEVKGPR